MSTCVLNETILTRGLPDYLLKMLLTSWSSAAVCTFLTESWCVAGEIRAIVWGVLPKTETAPARFDAHVLTLQYDVDPFMLHIRAVQMLCLTEYPLHAVISDPTNDGVLVAASPLTDIRSFEQYPWGMLHICVLRLLEDRSNASELAGCGC